MYFDISFPPVAGCPQETMSCPRCPGVVVCVPSVLWPGPVVVDTAVTVLGDCGTVVTKRGAVAVDS